MRELVCGTVGPAAELNRHQTIKVIKALVRDNISSDKSKTAARLFLGSRFLGSVLGGLVIGVAIQLQQPGLFATWVYVGLTLVSALFLLWTLLRVNRVALGTVFTLLFAAALGFGLTGLRAGAFQKTSLDPALEGKDILITGRVAAMPQFGEDGLRFRFEVASARVNEQVVALPPLVYLGWYTGFGARPVKKTSFSLIFSRVCQRSRRRQRGAVRVFAGVATPAAEPARWRALANDRTAQSAAWQQQSAWL